MRPSVVVFGDNLVVRNVTVINGASTFGEAASAVDQTPRNVVFRNGLFVSESEDASATAIDGSDCFLIPGLIDLQLNDFEWFTSEHSEEENVARFLEVAQAMFEEGVTSYVLASLAMPWPSLLSYCRGAARFRETSFEVPFGKQPFCFDDNFVGVMVEGLYMNRKFRGCHNGCYVMDVQAGDWPMRLEQLMATKGVFSINIAPETNPTECLRLIKDAKEKYNAVVAIGHCQPTGDLLKRAVEEGVEYVIHLGNGATGTSWKKFFGGGMLEESLQNDNLHVTLIADGFHLSKRYVRDWVARKELHRVSFVTDRAFALTCPKEFCVFGINGRREETPKGSFLRIYNKGDPTDLAGGFHLFGSHASMLEIFENTVAWYSKEVAGVNVRLHPKFSLHGAMSIAVALCSSNPARVIKRDHYLGRIEKGYVSNCLLVKLVYDEDKRRHRVKIVKVIVGKRK